MDSPADPGTLDRPAMSETPDLLDKQDFKDREVLQDSLATLEIWEILASPDSKVELLKCSVIHSHYMIETENN